MERIFEKSSESASENGGFLLVVENRRTKSDDIISKNISKKVISLTSSAHFDHIFRSQDGPSESVGKGSGIFGKARGTKRGEGWVGEGKKKERGGVGG